MKLENAIKKVSKLATVSYDEKRNEYFAVLNNDVIVFGSYSNSFGNDVDFVSVRNVNNIEDSQTDYFPQYYCKNISHAIRLATAC